MHLLTYTALFSELARRHVAIQASPENGRFMRLLISFDPVQKQLDLSEFYGKLRSGLKAKAGQPFLVVENYQADYDDNHGDYFSRKLNAAFLVLQYCQLDDYAARDAAIDQCERIAEQVFAAALERLRDDYQVYVSVGDAWTEHIGPIADGHVGVRLSFSWKENATENLTYDPSNFLP